MNGIILIDKPAGISSAEVVRRIKRLVKPARVGHLGTLDPFATGLLPIMVGEATKLAPLLEGGDKEYSGLIRLGAETDTLDRDGAVVRTAPVPALMPALLASVAAKFTGAIEQTPPLYSAIKRDGVPLYKLARRGGEVPPPEPRSVTIKRLELSIESPDSIRFTALCSPGTYARALARDIGAALGSLGYLCELRRLANGAFRLDVAHQLEEVLERIESAAPEPCVIGMRDAVAALPEIAIDRALETRLRNGDSRALDGLAPNDSRYFKVISSSGDLIAVARSTSRVTAVIERVFVE
ncbi:MAG TPA: tRNA pseudouridine(55) synthase TruB [Candidatus Binataceae bacterium]|nr:tRNA pseudouridine(55) synthase TruB [Candidatus Binataceae bacterium]